MNSEKIEQEIIKEVKNNLSEEELKKIIREKIKQKGYLKEEWQEHYAVERIIKEMKDAKYKKYKIKLGAWFIFYTYVRSTIGIILGYGSMQFYNQILSDSGIVLNEVITYTQIILIIVLIVGLDQKAKWGFKYNKFFIIYEWIWGAIALGIGNIVGGLLFLVIWYPIWVRPNRIYFNNRKYLFE